MKRRVLLAGLAAAGLVAALSGCTLANAITPPVQAALYPTLADSQASSSVVKAPSWVPENAVMIRMKENTETGDAIMQFGVPTPATIGTTCDPSIAGNTPPLDDTWWPQALDTSNILCQDGWHIVFMYGSQYFAWKP
ncbi:hypothetical protein VD659_11360 [Herbiconiux sp. 11R-BC]|uniref:hypothetical protein n=1 Tax=Herbiconiux sp. 11R-BC TaxID=3111637 RepID=UPI0010F85670